MILIGGLETLKSRRNMLETLKNQLRPVLRVALASTPWLASMYFLYWLGKTQAWVPETPHRDKVTIAVVAAGMAASFVVHCYFTKRAKK